ncbi:MAG: hypothetical protein OEV19_02010 [Candidatus Bathyarchaeota archaeon]|nr:hypothetical protein [Candidatus Bathyarchaeota archaeon]
MRTIQLVWLVTLKVKDIMVGEVITIEANATVRKAYWNRHRKRHAETSFGCRQRPTAAEVGEIMSKPLLFMESKKKRLKTL